MKQYDDEALVAHFLHSAQTAVPDDGFTDSVLQHIASLPAAEPEAAADSVAARTALRMARYNRGLTLLGYAAVIVAAAWVIVEACTSATVINAAHALMDYNADALLIQAVATGHRINSALPPLSHIVVVAIGLSIVMASQVPELLRRSVSH